MLDIIRCRCPSYSPLTCWMEGVIQLILHNPNHQIPEVIGFYTYRNSVSGQGNSRSSAGSRCHLHVTPRLTVASLSIPTSISWMLQEWMAGFMLICFLKHTVPDPNVFCNNQRMKQNWCTSLGTWPCFRDLEVQLPLPYSFFFLKNLFFF